MIGGVEYPVDTSKPPAFFFPGYLEARLPTSWDCDEELLDSSELHPLARWISDFRIFLDEFERRGLQGEYNDIVSAGARATCVLAYDMYCLDGNRRLQDSLIRRLIDRRSFQGALHEIGVAATMIRAGFQIDFENETDGSRKHPEFIAVHHGSKTRIAVEAKSIHRTGVLGFDRGNPPPTVHTANAHKIAAQVCGQVDKALPKANGLPLYVFVDLNLPPNVADAFAPLLLDEFKAILPQVDTGVNASGVFVGRTMNLLTVTNRPAHLGEKMHNGGDTLNVFVSPVESECRFPAGSHHIPDIKAAMNSYGTVPGA